MKTHSNLCKREEEPYVYPSQNLDRVLRRRGRALALGICPSTTRPVPGGYIEKTAEGFEIHYPHLPLKKLTTLEEAKRSLELAPPISTAGLKVGRIADEDSDLISSAEAGEILGVSRFRVNAMVASGVLPGRRDNGKILVDRAAAEQKAAPRPPRGTSREVRQPFPVLRASRRTHAICG